jgi:hypothetical protein
MKKILNLTLKLIAMVVVLTSCEQKMSMHSVVGSDGSLERTIIINDANEDKLTKNIFGVSEKNGWTVKAQVLPNENDEKGEQKKRLTFSRKFDSVEHANGEMDTNDDTLFHVRSDLTTYFRWFYTYHQYSDTYRAINRFKNFPITDYFTEEDSAFVKRLPAEGKPMSKADSIYLQGLNDKIYETYALNAIYEEHYLALVESMKSVNAPSAYLDTVAKYKAVLFGEIKENEDLPDDFILTLLKGIKDQTAVEKISEAYRVRRVPIEKKINFMCDAASGKYLHSITVPWRVSKTNADSIHGSTVVWNPPVIKFLLSDYVMTVEGRNLNLWPTILSAAFILVTLALFVNKITKRKTV